MCFCFGGNCLVLVFGGVFLFRGGGVDNKRELNGGCDWHSHECDCRSEHTASDSFSRGSAAACAFLRLVFARAFHLFLCQDFQVNFLLLLPPSFGDGMDMLLPCLCLFLGFFFYIYSNGAAPCDFNAIFFLVFQG